MLVFNGLYFFLLHKGDVRGCQSPRSVLVEDVPQAFAVNSTMEMIRAAVLGVGSGEERQDPRRGSS